MRVGAPAFDDAEELALNLFGDRAAAADADLDTIDGTNGRNLGGGAAEEHFVGDIEHFPRDQSYREEPGP